MTVNANLKKTIIVVAVVLITIGCIWGFMATKDVRRAKSEYKQLEKFANRQAVEIAIIEQSVRLQQLKMAIKKAQMKAPPVIVESKVPDSKGK